MLTKNVSDYDWVSAKTDVEELTVTITLAEYRSLLRRTFEDGRLIADLRDQVRGLGGSPAVSWGEPEGEVS